MIRHTIDLNPNSPPAKKQKTTQEYSIKIENHFDITLQVEEKIATSTYALIYHYINTLVSIYYLNNIYESIKNVCEISDPIPTLLAFANKLNKTFIIYDLNTELVYHNIKTNTKIQMHNPIKTANYLIYSNGNWYPGILKGISLSNDIIGYKYQSFFKRKEPNKHEFDVRFTIARLSIEMLANFPKNGLFNPNPYYNDDTPETEELVKNVLRENNYPDITQHLFGILSTNLSTLIKKVNKSTQKINETNITTNIKFFTRIKDFPQFNQNIIDLLKIFYRERIENLLNQIDRFLNKQHTLNEITKFIVIIGEKLPNFTEEIIRFIAPVMKNLYLKNTISRSNITFFVNTLQEKITLNIDIDRDRTNDLTTLINELFHNDILSLQMLCLKHINFWSDEQKTNLNLPTELYEWLNNTLQYPG